ncbi:MAG TPA: molybdenum cofactor guanylyltransferase [Acidimicrobiales bacterium]
MAGSPSADPVSAGPATASGGWAGAVLCGGASSRMGRDKALIVLDGRPLAVRVAEALARAGARRVAAIGGDGAALAAAGLDPVPDDWPGAGPLGGLVTALRWAGGVAGGPQAVVVAACDLLAPSPAALEATVAALGRDPSADAAVPVVGDRRQWVHGAWRPTAESPLSEQLERGRRAIHAAVARARLAVVEVEGLPPGALADADVPDDLPDGLRQRPAG